MILEITVNRKSKTITEEREIDEEANIDYDGLAHVLAEGFLKWLTETSKQSA